jgi:hypothetical protein
LRGFFRRQDINEGASFVARRAFMRFVQKTIRCEVALRVIGQDLGTFLIDSLEITVEGEDFAVKGLCFAYTADAPTENREKRWQKLFSIDRRGGEIRHKSIRQPFIRKYTPEDIKRLDETAKERRVDIPQIQGVSTLAHSLRTIGRVVDSSGGRLIKLVKSQDNVTLEYADANGVSHKEEQSSYSLYRKQHSEVSLRETKKEKDLWSGRDR